MVTSLASPVLTPGDINHTSQTPSVSVRSTAKAVQRNDKFRGQNSQVATQTHSCHTRTHHSLDQRMTTPKISSTTSAPRKSQFNTLPQEVDSALSVVYRELEGVPLLRQKISDLESELARVHQESNIQRNELALSRRVVERARMAEDELQRLRAEATKRWVYTKEITILKVKNQELESEVTGLRSELNKVHHSLARVETKAADNARLLNH
ncbi:hypothetical protein BDV30DRAFT_247505 [Aspergillus minisclerotigenes]|uniref:Uncharacterized protein n=1 Tax=Aspergillus minisclerotigenes TaxID=656917 RepID=A0A5N6JC89_9EURO|nr:hypothetical protein BDV30DRAFT_247505 [Aspergillus minisclerotigenes]